MSTVERLNELLDQKDAELEKCQDENARLRRQLDFGVDWMLHTRGEGKKEFLPVPRIQMSLTYGEDRYQEYVVAMVLPNRDTSVTYVPICYSKTTGGRMDVTEVPTKGELPDHNVNDLPGILSDACFAMEKTGMPAYVFLDPEHVYKVTSLRPLKLQVV